MTTSGDGRSLELPPRLLSCHKGNDKIAMY